MSATLFSLRIHALLCKEGGMLAADRWLAHRPCRLCTPLPPPAAPTAVRTACRPPATPGFLLPLLQAPGGQRNDAQNSRKRPLRGRLAMRTAGARCLANKEKNAWKSNSRLASATNPHHRPRHGRDHSCSRGRLLGPRDFAPQCFFALCQSTQTACACIGSIQAPRRSPPPPARQQSSQRQPAKASDCGERLTCAAQASQHMRGLQPWLSLACG